MGGKILVVEDNPLNLRLVQDLLEYRGHEIQAATSVPEARERLRSFDPELLLVDVEIPGGGGPALLREVRADRAHAHLPVIAVTAQAMSGDRERLLELGFDAYFSKPIDTRTFGPAVESFLKKG